LEEASKIYLILDSLKESKYEYIAVVNPKTDEKLMKLKINLKGDNLIDFLDTFFDAGFKVVKISKEEFDSLKTDDVLKFKV
jgi:hypothetical protein